MEFEWNQDVGCPHELSPEFLLRELAEHVASYLDVPSLGSLFCVSRRLYAVPSVQRVWKSLVEKKFFEPQRLHAELPMTFNYLKYCREKTIWKYPLLWDRVKTSEHPSVRSRSGVCRLGNDKFVVIGGHIRQGDFLRENDIWCFDTKTEEFKQIQPVLGKEPPKISRLSCESFDNIVYSFGGILQNKKKVNNVCTLDIESREWKELEVFGTVPTGRCDSVTCAYSNGSKRGMLVFGGSQDGLLYPSEIHFFNVDTRTWEPVNIVNDSPSERIGCCATVIGDKFYLYGGALWNKETSLYTSSYHEMWCLHLNKDGCWYWKQLPCYGEGPSGTPVNLTSVAIGNQILIEGSMNTTGSFLYDTVTYTWSKLTSKTSPNDSNFGNAVLVGESVYYVCGYRGHTYARDVIKLSLSALLNFVNNGVIPDFMRDSKKGEPMEEEGSSEDLISEKGAKGLEFSSSSSSSEDIEIH